MEESGIIGITSRKNLSLQAQAHSIFGDIRLTISEEWEIKNRGTHPSISIPIYS